MDLNDLLGRLGSRSDDPSLARFLADYAISVEEELELPDGEFNAYVERPAQGYALVFTDEAVLDGELHVPIGVRPLCLSGVFIYLTEVDDYREFAGSLPFGLPRPLDREVLARSFGVADWRSIEADGSLAAERWDINTDRRIHATYRRGSGRVSVLSVSKPDAEHTPGN